MAVTFPAWGLNILRGHTFTRARPAPTLEQMLRFLQSRSTGPGGPGPGWVRAREPGRGLVIDTRA